MTIANTKTIHLQSAMEGMKDKETNVWNAPREHTVQMTMVQKLVSPAQPDPTQNILEVGSVVSKEIPTTGTLGVFVLLMIL